jgi:hypothetical protein
VERGDAPITAEGQDPGAGEHETTVFADDLPDHLGPADLGQRG